MRIAIIGTGILGLTSAYFLIEDHGVFFYSYLQSMPHIRLSEMSQLPRDLDSFDVVISGSARHSETTIDRLTRFVHAGGGWHIFVDLSDRPLPEIFGVQQGPIGAGR